MSIDDYRQHDQPWLRVRPYVPLAHRRADGTYTTLNEGDGSMATPASLLAPFRDDINAPCAACGQDDEARTRRSIKGTTALLMLCDNARACGERTAAR